MNALQQEINHREDEIAHLNEKIKERELHVDAALVSNTLNKVNIKTMEAEMIEKDETIADLRQQLSKT